MFKLNHRIKFIRNLVCTLLCMGMLVNLHAFNEPQKLTFDDLIQLDQRWMSNSIIPPQLTELNNQPIEIRGFLYEQSNGQWILSALPNLKSCCLDNEAVVGTRLNVSWRSKPQASALAVMLSGNLNIEMQHPKKIYNLKNAEILSQASFSWLYAILLACLLAAPITLFLKAKK